MTDADLTAETERSDQPTMGTIRVHEFTSLDGVIDTPAWTVDFGFDPAMGQDIGNLMSGCRAILLGRNTYEMFAPAWSSRTVEEDPGAPFMNESTKYVVSSTLQEGSWQNTRIRRPVRPGRHPPGQDRSRRRYLRQRQLHSGPGPHR